MEQIVFVVFKRDRYGLIDEQPFDGGIPVAPSRSKRHTPPTGVVIRPNVYFMGKIVGHQPGCIRYVQVLNTIEGEIARILHEKDPAASLRINDYSSVSIAWPEGLHLSLVVDERNRVSISDIRVPRVSESTWQWSRTHQARIEELKQFCWQIAELNHLDQLFAEYNRTSQERRALLHTCLSGAQQNPESIPWWLTELLQTTKQQWRPPLFPRKQLQLLADCSNKELEQLFRVISRGAVTIHFHHQSQLFSLESMPCPQDRQIWNQENPFSPLPLNDPWFWQKACQISGVKMNRLRRRNGFGKAKYTVIFLLAIHDKILHFAFPEEELDKLPLDPYQPDQP